MAIGLVGQKCGMTRIFAEDGNATPVTVIQLQPNVITQIKTKENDGYTALQLTTGKKKKSRVTKPLAGHYAKANVEPGIALWECRMDPEQVAEYKLGDEIKLDAIFAEGQKVDVTSISKGKGFQGAVKRHNFRTQDASHGNSLSHRAPGSIGQNQSPGRVFKGKKMAGQMGNERVTVASLKVTAIDVEKQLIMVNGSVPGAVGAKVTIKLAEKAQG
jgi:large subunit ribosomal protein L3